MGDALKAKPRASNDSLVQTKLSFDVSFEVLDVPKTCTKRFGFILRIARLWVEYADSVGVPSYNLSVFKP